MVRRQGETESRFLSYLQTRDDLALPQECAMISILENGRFLIRNCTAISFINGVKAPLRRRLEQCFRRTRLDLKSHELFRDGGSASRAAHVGATYNLGANCLEECRVLRGMPVHWQK